MKQTSHWMMTRLVLEEGDGDPILSTLLWVGTFSSTGSLLILTGGVAGGVGGRIGDEGVLDDGVLDAGVEIAFDIFFFRFLV